MYLTKVFVFAVLIPLFYSNTVFAQSSYRVNHKSTAKYFTSRRYINAHDGGTIIVGKWGLQESQSQPYVLKVNKSGQLKWARKIETDRDTYEFFVCELVDGSIIFAGNSQYNGSPVYSDITLIKFTCDGNIAWSKNVTVGVRLSNRFLTPYSLKPGKNNDVILSFHGRSNNSQVLVISRINDSGNAEWTKTFYGSDGETLLPAVAFTSGNSVVAVGMNSFYTNFFNYYKSFFAVSMNYDDGSVQVIKGYDYSEHITNSGVQISHQSNHFYVEQLTSGGFALFGEFSNYDPNLHYFFKLTLKEDLTIDKTISYSVPVNLGKQWAKMRVLPNGESHILSLTPTYQQLCWYAADANNVTIRQKKIDYPGSYVDLWYAPAANGPNAVNLIVSRMFQPEGSIEITQLNNQSSLPNVCIGEDTSYVQLIPWNATEGTMTWQSIVEGGVLISPLPLSASDIVITSEYACEPGIMPDSEQEKGLKIVGDGSVCEVGLPVVFVGRVLNGSTKVNWQISGNDYEKFEQVNDSTLVVVFKPNAASTHKLRAYTETCEVLSDSIDIRLHPKPHTTITQYQTCEFPLQIAAGNGYKSYKWQDGSSNAVFNAPKSGVYQVELEPYCGTKFIENINVQSGTCMNKISLPNAFTPNKDGKNDVFKPSILGMPQFYEMTIFNRWGQVVFKSSSFQSGWDGSLRGSPQKSELFICVVRYRFPNEALRLLKGSVLLVR